MNDTCTDASRYCRASVLPSARPTPCVFDRAAVLKRLDGNEELLRELVEMFCEATPARMSDLRAAIADHDADRLASVSHSLKGSLGNIGGQRAIEAAVRLEEMARLNDLDQAPRAFDFLECEIKRLTLEILQQVAG